MRNKKFNDVGLCIPGRHYMADTSSKLAAIVQLVEEGLYFTINRPRQYGKTTIAHLLYLRFMELEDYLPLSISFEGIGDVVFEQELSFCRTFIRQIARALKHAKEDALETQLTSIQNNISTLDQLSQAITQLCEQTTKKLVLLIDEIDKSSNNQLFLSFLGILRQKYLGRNVGRDSTFQSIILIGVHDVKTLQSKIAPDSKGKLNSPWNIAIDFKIDMNFNPQEIQVMLEDYVQQTGVQMDTATIAKELYYYTLGYPFLVSKTCKFIDESILPNQEEKQWTVAEVNQAIKMITYGGYTTTLFDSISKNLENDPLLYQMIFDISINGKVYAYNINNPLIHKAALHGLIKDKNGSCEIHNRIFEQRFYDYFLSKKALQDAYVLEEGMVLYSKNGLHLPAILKKFQQFYKEQYANKDIAFLEREGRLLFLSFLRPIINGKGFEFKEPVIGQERRMDIVITFLQYRYVVELKRWRGPKYHQEGLEQLCDYLDTYSLQKGYLLIYDFRQSKEYKEEWIRVKGKEIFAVWV